MRAILTLFALFACVAFAQLPDTPAGRQFMAWRTAQDSGDRATIQQFLEKNLPRGRVEQELAMHDRTGGYEIRKVEQSSDLHIEVLVQERGGARQFARVIMDVASGETHEISGIRIQPAQPPASMAPPKLTPAEQEAARKQPPFRQFSAWLEVFNSGDRSRISRFREACPRHEAVP